MNEPYNDSTEAYEDQDARIADLLQSLELAEGYISTIDGIEEDESYLLDVIRASIRAAGGECSADVCHGLDNGCTCADCTAEIEEAIGSPTPDHASFLLNQEA